MLILGVQSPQVHCNTLQHTATHCKTLQHTATHCNTYTATHTLQQTVVFMCCVCWYVYPSASLQHTGEHHDAFMCFPRICSSRVIGTAGVLMCDCVDVFVYVWVLYSYMCVRWIVCTCVFFLYVCQICCHRKCFYVCVCLDVFIYSYTCLCCDYTCVCVKLFVYVCIFHMCVKDTVTVGVRFFFMCVSDMLSLRVCTTLCKFLQVYVRVLCACERL